MPAFVLRMPDKGDTDTSSGKGKERAHTPDEEESEEGEISPELFDAITRVAQDDQEQDGFQRELDAITAGDLRETLPSSVVDNTIRALSSDTVDRYLGFIESASGYANTVDSQERILDEFGQLDRVDSQGRILDEFGQPERVNPITKPESLNSSDEKLNNDGNDKESYATASSSDKPGPSRTSGDAVSGEKSTSGSSPETNKDSSSSEATEFLLLPLSISTEALAIINPIFATIISIFKVITDPVIKVILTNKLFLARYKMHLWLHNGLLLANTKKILSLCLFIVLLLCLIMFNLFLLCKMLSIISWI